jgi:hypothetical protein
MKDSLLINKGFMIDWLINAKAMEIHQSLRIDNAISIQLIL